MDPNIVVWRKCTPFCDKAVECPEHHEMLQAIVNCTDQLGHLSNLDVLKSCVEKYENMGWDKNDDIPDSVLSNRLPLIHWAAALGKCNALEWMLNSGFDPRATVSGIGENALHRAVLFLFKSRPKFTTKELKPKFKKVCSLLPELMSLPDHVNHDTPLHAAAKMLLNSDSRLVFFQTAIEVIASQAKEMLDTERSIVLDARNDDGDTCLHILAAVTEKMKADFSCQAISALLRAGADKTIKNNNDMLPLDIAMQKGSNIVVEELVKIVDPSSSHADSSSSRDPRSLMTMVDIPSHSRSSPPGSGASHNGPRNSYYSSSSPSLRDRSPHRSPSQSPGSPPLLHSRFEDESIHVVDPDMVVVKQEDDRIAIVESTRPGSAYSLSPSPSDSPLSNVDINSPLLQHLREAGLLSEVSTLLVRAKVRDEGQLRRLQQQANDLDTQIVYKLKEIEKIKQDVESLRKKRAQCDDEASNIRKRLSSCVHAIREMPSTGSNSVSGGN